MRGRVSVRAVAARLVQACLLLVGLSAALFALLSALPTNSVDLLISSNPHLSPSDVIRLKRLRGLDRPIWVQYQRWLLGAPAMRPLPQVTPLSPRRGKVGDRVVVPIEDALIGTQGWPDAKAFLKAYERIDSTGAADLAAAPLVRQALTADDGLIEAIRLARARHAAEVDALLEEVRATSRRSLKIECLTPACQVSTTAKGRALHLPVATVPVRHFFSSEDRTGAKAVGSVLVSPISPPVSTGEPKGSPEQDSVSEGAPPTCEWQPLPPFVVDGSAPLVKDLRGFLVQSEEVTTRFALARPASHVAVDAAGKITIQAPPGRAGTQVVLVTATVGVERALGWSERTCTAAAIVDFGPVADPDRRESGVIHAFVGDRSSLGYSSAFQQPVYDLLFGAPEKCGDGRASTGEACDDGNVDAGDGCSPTCTLESEAFAPRLERQASAFLRQPGRLWNTLFLMFPALVLSLMLALFFGVLAATNRGVVDHLLNSGAFAAMSVPVFWLGLMVVALFAEEWRLLPSSGAMGVADSGDGVGSHLVDRLRHLVLPVLVITAVYTGRWMRYVRGAISDVLPLDYVRTARAKGLSEARVLSRHVMRNALIPVVTIVSLSLPSLFGGALLTETVFSWPGLGSLQYEAVVKGDLYLAIVIFLLLAALVFASNLVADVLYTWIDPRARFGGDAEGRR